MSDEHKTVFESDLHDADTGGADAPTPSPAPSTASEGSIQITLSKDKIVTGLVVVEFLLLLVMGGQLIGIKNQLKSGDIKVAKADTPSVVAPAPSAAPKAAAPAGKADIKVTDADQIRGNKNAKVTIVEYSDFECPFCNKVTPTLEQVMDTYGDDVRIVYRHFPLNSIHQYAQKAAEAAECAGDQGKFWEYHDLIFANQAGLKGGDTQFKTWASQLGLNGSKFTSCLDSGEKAGKVNSDQSSGAALGVTGTPALFINGTKLEGAQPFAAFKAVIDQEL